MKKSLTKCSNTGLHGNLGGVYGDMTGVYGHVTGVYGDLTGIRGDLTGIRGDFDGCELTDDERDGGVDIWDLVGGAYTPPVRGVL